MLIFCINFMKLKIEEIKVKQIWDDFIKEVKPPTFLHSWSWGEFNEAMGTNVFRYGVYDSDVLIAVVLLLEIKAKRGSFLFCPHGPVILDLSKKNQIILFLANFLKDLAKRMKCSFVRISPLLESVEENEKIFIDSGFKQAPVHMMHPELGWILELNKSEEELLMAMRKTTRYCIKKAEKDGVHVVVSSNPDDVELFWSVYKETVDRQNFTPFTKNYLRTEFEIFSKDDNVRFFFAKYNDEVVAAALIVFSKNSAFYHHGASIHKYPKITAPYLLQWEVIKEAKKRGCEFYNFWGIVPEEKKDHPWAGLSLFKRGFGGSAHAYVHAKDLIVSPKYWLNFLVETVRKKRRRL